MAINYIDQTILLSPRSLIIKLTIMDMFILGIVVIRAYIAIILKDSFFIKAF